MGMCVGFGVSLPSAGKGPASLNIYVDSVAGSNANDGLTTSTAKQTIAGIPLANNVTINLKRGSKWREMLDTTAYNGIKVQDYGSGQLPVLDCSDVIPNSGWTQPNAGTYPNVWQITVTSGASLSGMFASIWVNGVRLKYVAGIATVNSTANSFTTADGSSGGQYGATTTTYQINSGSIPNSDGKTYEWASRLYGFVANGNVSVNNIHTRRNAHNNGSLVAGPNASVNGCIFEDGCKHNTYVSPGSVFTNCIAWKCDWMVAERQGWSGFVAHNAVNTGVETATFIGCQTIAEIAVFNAYASSGGMLGFYHHTSSGAGNAWKKITFIDCSVQYCVEAFNGADCFGVDHTRSHVKGCTYGVELPDGDSVGNNAVNTVTDCWVEESDGIVNNRAVVPAGSSCIIDGLRVWQSTGFNHAYVYGDGGGRNYTLKRSALARTAGSTGVISFVSTPGTTSAAQFSGNVMYGDNSGFGEDLLLIGGGGSNTDHNAYGGSNSGFNTTGNGTGTGYLKLGPYMTAAQGAGKETGSVSLASNPFTNAPAGDFSLTAGSGLDASVFGLARFPTYQTILTTAVLATM